MQAYKRPISRFTIDALKRQSDFLEQSPLSEGPAARGLRWLPGSAPGDGARDDADDEQSDNEADQWLLSAVRFNLFQRRTCLPRPL